MRIKYPITFGVTVFGILLGLALLVFVAGGIVARHHINPLVAVVDAAEANVKTLAKSLKGESRNEEYFTSAYYHMRLTTHETTGDGAGDNVAFVPLADGYLIGKRAGALNYVQIDGPEGSDMSVQRLATSVPTNKEEFLADGEDFNRSLRIQFGVKDLFLQTSDDGLNLYATHHYWHSDQQCAVMRLSVLEFSVESLLTDNLDDQWRAVFESQPCMDLDNKPNHDGNNNAFLHSGGRLDLLDEQHLLMTVGEHVFDSIHNDNLVQDPNASYGKVLLIDLAASSASLFSLGHRNPQGLYVDQEGNIWATEHGPRGGDELNLIEEGTNYGWPLVSYGTDYGGVTVPEHLDWAGHDNYQKPVFAWLPSIAANNLIKLENSGFSLWEGNLIVASLKDQAIHRLVLDGRRVVITERISIGSRVRDLLETEDGELLLLTDDGKLVFIEALTEDALDQQLPVELQAARLWVNCESCHSLAGNGKHSVGPNLHNIVGSPVARFDDYNYSKAFVELDGQWTPERLDKFLADPQGFAPGTAMMFPGLKDPADRQLLIDYLQSH